MSSYIFIYFYFWVCRGDFPHLSGQGSWGVKNNHVKGTSAGSLSRQKSMSSRPTEKSLSSSPGSLHSSLKGKRDAMTKRSGNLTHSCCSFFMDVNLHFILTLSLFLCFFLFFWQRLWVLEIGVRVSALGLLGQKVCSIFACKKITTFVVLFLVVEKVRGRFFHIKT